MRIGGAPSIYFRDASLCTASWNDVFFELWSAHGTLAHMREVHDRHMAFIRAHEGRKTSCISSVRIPSYSSITEEYRRAANERTRDVAPGLHAWCVVVPFTGFGASLLRSVLIGMRLATRPPYAATTFADHDEACEFIAPYMQKRPNGQPYLATELRYALDVISRATDPVGALR